jgi:hypothetical protein
MAAKGVSGGGVCGMVKPPGTARKLWCSPIIKPLV